ncbi:MAG: DUF3987 domain-containing protein [Bacteroidaceae bacterium]|nr:DUF3987 domain-containing protein [Bacteroidaceae bacterium]
MKLDIYNNLKSKRPFTSWRSLADMYNYLEVNRNIAAVVKKYQETGDKSLKENKLPAMMPMGDVGDLQRAKQNCEPTGLVMIDLDNKGDIAPDVVHWWEDEDPVAKVKSHFDEREAELERMHVVLVHVTPSGRGLRLLVHCHAEGMEATIQNCVKAFDLEKLGKVDPACTDLSRLSCLVPADYIVYEKGLFDEVPAISIEAMRRYKVTGKVAKGENTQRTLFEVQESDEEFKDYAYNGVPVSEIVKEWMEENGGEPLPNTRHNYYNDLVLLFRGICDNDPKILHAVLPKFGHTDEETWEQCVGLTLSNKCTKIDYRLWKFLADKGYWIDPKAKKEEEMEEQEEQGARGKEQVKPMPALPPIFRQYVQAAPPDFKTPCVFALLPILGTLTSHLRAAYFDDMEQSTTFTSLIFAPPSSGKGFIKRLMPLLSNIADRDELNRAREQIYAKAEAKKGANEKGLDDPHVSVRIVKPMISIPEFLQKMEDNRGHHMFIMAEELDTFKKANTTTGGDKSDMWRVAWDNDKYGQYYKSVHTYKGETNLYLNMLFTCTPDQMPKFFKNVEDGLVSRFSFCEVENQLYAPYQPWKKIPQKEKLRIQNILNRLEMLNYTTPLKVDPKDFKGMKEKDFIEDAPWEVQWQPHQHINMEWMYKPLLNWLEVQRKEAAKELNEARDMFRKRASLKAFRLAMLCTALYPKVGVKEKVVIRDFALWFADTDLRNSLMAFGQKYNERGDENKASGKKTYSVGQSVYDTLPDRFTRGELDAVVRRCGLKTPVKAVICNWKKLGMIVKHGENEWQKKK